MRHLKSLVFMLIIALMIGVVCGCSDNKEQESMTDESSITDSDSNSDSNSDSDSTSDSNSNSDSDSESSVDMEDLQMQDMMIRAKNTEYSDRYEKFLDTLRTTDYTITYSIRDSDNNNYDYKVVRNGDDWYYKKTDKSDKTEYEYYEKDGMGYFFDKDNKICVVISETAKTIEDVMPVSSGMRYKETSTEKFKGKSYSCDIFDVISGQYADNKDTLKESTTGLIRVFYDDKDNVVGIVEAYDNTGVMQETVVGKIGKVDKSVFKVKEGYKSLTITNYLKQYG